MDVIERAPSSFQLLGLDFMVSANWKVWFIEANNYPLWPKGQPEINSFINTMGVCSTLIGGWNASTDSYYIHVVMKV